MRICFEASREERERENSEVFRVSVERETSFRFSRKKKDSISLLITSLLLVVVVVVTFYS